MTRAIRNEKPHQVVLRARCEVLDPVLSIIKCRVALPKECQAGKVLVAPLDGENISCRVVSHVPGLVTGVAVNLLG